MTSVRTGVRELVRVVMRERGIRHSSNDKFVNTVCYAEQSLRCVEYQGPIFIRYDEEKQAIEAIAYAGYNPVVISLWHPTVIFNPKVNALAHEKTTQDFNYEHMFLGFNRPDFCDILGTFLDKYIADRNKRPSKWKNLYRDTDQEVVFIPDLPGVMPPEKEETFVQTIISFVLRKFFDINVDKMYDDEAKLWKTAVQRHFRCSDEELLHMQNTVTAIRNIDPIELENNTRIIIDEEWKEYDAVDESHHS